MGKKLLFLFAVLFAVSKSAISQDTPRPWSITSSVDGNGVRTTTFDAGDEGLANNFNFDGTPGFTTEQQNLLKNANRLIFKGHFNEHTMQVLGAGQLTATFVSFKNAEFEETEGDRIYYTDCQGPNSVVPTTNALRFNIFKQVSEIELPTTIRSLCQNFLNKNYYVHTFTIPASVQYIARDAITDTPLTTITFPETVKYIESQSFMNENIESLVEVIVHGCPYAVTNAFDRKVTVAQTEVGDDVTYAHLTFDEPYSDFFVNKNHPLSVAVSSDPGAFQSWLVQHYEATEGGQAVNGWKQFINSGSDELIDVPDGKRTVLSTYSDDGAAHRVPGINFRAYLVKDVNGSTATLTPVMAFPKNTGVIIYGTIPENASGYSLPIVYDWADMSPYKRTSRNVEGYDMTNYLVPTSSSETGFGGPHIPGPYETNAAKTEVVERYFGLGRYSDTVYDGAASKVNTANDFVSFFRALNEGDIASNKAYLKLPKTVFNNPQGMEVTVPRDDAFTGMTWNGTVASGNWGYRDVDVMVKSIGEPGEEEYFLSIDDLKQAIEESEEVYTLQGVKISNPQKGIYIKNGKKFVVK